MMTKSETKTEWERDYHSLKGLPEVQIAWSFDFRLNTNQQGLMHSHELRRTADARIFPNNHF